MGENQSIVKFLNKHLPTSEFEVIPLAGDASARRYFRVVHGERSSVLMVWEPFDDIEKYPFLSVLNHFKAHEIQVPEVEALDPAMGMVLLEDLGDLTLERKFWENQDQSKAIPLYEKAIDELLKIHGSATQAKSEPCTAFDVAFDVEKLLWEMNYGRKHFLEKLCGISFSGEVSRELDRIFLDICSLLASEPRVICHRDYHSRNLMIKMGKMRVIDFQDARMGPIQYDLVSLIHDSYVDLNAGSVSHILNYYLGRAKEQREILIQEDRFFEIMNIQILQRCFKACGSFASFYNMRADTRYLKYIAKTVQKVHRGLGQYPSYRRFKEIIEDHNLLERDFTDLCAR